MPAAIDLSGPTAGAAYALGSALSWTLTSLIVRALAERFSTVSINVVRSAGAGILLVAGTLAWNGARTLRGITPAALAYLATSTLIAIGVGDTAFFESTKLIGMARALTVAMVYPLIAAGLALVILGEPVTLALVLGAVVTLGGLALIVAERTPPGTERPGHRGRAVALALLTAVAWAVSALLMKPPLREVDPITAQAVRLPIAALVLGLTPWARGTARDVRVHGRRTGGLIAAASLFTVLSSVLFVAGLKYAGVATATVLSSTAPLFALPIGLVAFGETVTWRATGGAALCVTGIALLTR